MILSSDRCVFVTEKQIEKIQSWERPLQIEYFIIINFKTQFVINIITNRYLKNEWYLFRIVSMITKYWK